ncbi:predicted protein [Naegleria gruberi]|uniref:Predicted protein n=1 Tax=Naegleria gruberi TaxID=5762 RepID=D2VCY9_NAEGR|nr:uncharacterized protein NAEGRDRAFT_66736 [Naegleria gruberi]EFC45387.1 predicted protein [Naegleria gruberi]|eukprot:XP_002678131.1 predicted protein [Naegleria gruberi strain NEG-M]
MPKTSSAASSASYLSSSTKLPRLGSRKVIEEEDCPISSPERVERLSSANSKLQSPKSNYSSPTAKSGVSIRERAFSRARSGMVQPILLSSDDEDGNGGTFYLTEVGTMAKKKLRKKKIVGWNVKEVELTADGPLPFELKFDPLIDNLMKNIRISDSDIKAVFEKNFSPYNHLNRSIIQNSFWFVYSLFFQDKPEVCERFISELSLDSAKFALNLGRHHRDAFFEVYHLAVAYCILKALRKHFSACKKLFTTNFKVRVYEVICEVFLGIRYKREFLHSQRTKYFPKKSEDTFFEKLLRKQSKKSTETSKSKKKEVDQSTVSKSTTAPRPDSASEKEFYSSSEEEEETPDEMEEIDNTSKDHISDQIQKLGLDENYHALPSEVLEQEIEAIENRKKKLKLANKEASKSNVEQGKKQKELSPRIRNPEYFKYFSNGQTAPMQDKYWYTFQMSPLMLKALRKPPAEFALNYTSPELGKNKVRLIHKDGFSKPIFFGSLSDPNKLVNNVKKFQKVWNPDSIEEVEKVRQRLKTNKEMRKRSTQESDRDIRWIKGSTREELRVIEQEKREVLQNKDSVSNVCNQIIKKNIEESTSRAEKRYQTVPSSNFKGSAFATVLHENYNTMNKKLQKLDKLLSTTGDRCLITKEQHLKEEEDLGTDLDKKDPPKALNVSLFDYL